MCDGKDEMRVCLKNSHKYEARTDQWEAAGPDGRNAITWEVATVGLGADARLALPFFIFLLLPSPMAPRPPPNTIQVRLQGLPCHQRGITNPPNDPSALHP